MISKLFSLRGKLPEKVCLIIEATGWGILLLAWSLATYFEVIPHSLLPSPWKVLTSFSELHYQDALIRNLIYSIKINLMGDQQAQCF